MLITIQRGLGDAIYAQPVIRELAKTQKIFLETEFSELYNHLDNIIVCNKFTDEQRKLKPKKLYWYTNYPNAFSQLCKNADVKELEFKLDIPLIAVQQFETDKKLCIVKAPYSPQYLTNANKHYKDFAGSLSEIQKFIDDNRKEFYFISTGDKTDYTGNLTGIDCDLNDKLSLLQFLSLCKQADIFVSQIGHLLAIACVYRKKIKIVSSNTENPHVYRNRLKSSVIPGTCILL